jgi:hypothetical protein
MVNVFAIGVVIDLLVSIVIYFIIKRRVTYANDLLVGMVVVGCFLSFLFSLPISNALSNPYHCDVVSQSEIKLYAGYTADGITGNFFILSGTIGTEDRVVYWYQTPDKLLHKTYVRSEISAFAEEDRKDGVLITKTYDCKANSPFGNAPFFRDLTYYYFYVPIGSIRTGFNIQ